MQSLASTVTLNNGVKMPVLGLGVYLSKEGDEAYNAVRWALDAGYRAIDTAAVYGNEESVGRAIRDSSIPRDQIFVTTKLWNTRIRAHEEQLAFRESLKKLGLDYVDLYLIHWPVREEQGYLRAWKEMEAIYAAGGARAIGVSNYHAHHLRDLFRQCNVPPVIDQVECHPELSQVSLATFCQQNNIVFEPWSPLGRGSSLSDPTLLAIAEKYGKTTAQVILRWGLQRGFVNIPKSTHQDRIISNAQIFDFQLTDEDMAAIFALNKDQRTGSNPETFTF